jgi:hypothetical protein
VNKTHAQPRPALRAAGNWGSSRVHPRNAVPAASPAASQRAGRGTGSQQASNRPFTREEQAFKKEGSRSHQTATGHETAAVPQPGASHLLHQLPADGPAGFSRLSRGTGPWFTAGRATGMEKPSRLPKERHRRHPLCCQQQVTQQQHQQATNRQRTSGSATETGGQKSDAAGTTHPPAHPRYGLTGPRPP